MAVGELGAILLAYSMTSGSSSLLRLSGGTRAMSIMAALGKQVMLSGVWLT